MIHTLLWPAFLLSLPSLATASALEQQHILSAPTPGTLRRFHPNTRTASRRFSASRRCALPPSSVRKSRLPYPTPPTANHIAPLPYSSPVYPFPSPFSLLPNSSPFPLLFRSAAFAFMFPLRHCRVPSPPLPCVITSMPKKHPPLPVQDFHIPTPTVTSTPGNPTASGIRIARSWGRTRRV
ncbi:hypothetical protein B0H11DRAFT_57664 [Mycena galericulata]|nr:hypothetical protein B0H11DRAFT_57664 [Mycena galericulata]